MAEQKLMDGFQFRLKRKPIDMAIFISSPSDLVKARDEFLEQIKITPPETTIQSSVDELLEKAESHLKKWAETPSEGDQNPRQELARKQSLKTQARLSHLKLMKKEDFHENVPNDEKIAKADCFARCLCMFMDRLKISFSQLVAKQLFKVAKEIALAIHDDVFTKSFLEQTVNAHMEEINKSTFECDNVPWQYELHSTAAKVSFCIISKKIRENEHILKTDF
jgi:hypothetical protein